MAVVKTSCNVVTRVGSYPVVASAISQASDMYGKVKESNSLVKYTLESAETVTTMVSDKALPIVTSTLNGTVDKVNELACSQLDKLEGKYPIITEPTEKVLGETKKAYESSMVKPAVDKITCATKYGVETVTDMKNYGVEKVNGVASYASSTVSGVKNYSIESAVKIRDYGTQKLNESMKTPLGQAVTKKLDGTITTLDSMVDYYLPGSEPACERNNTEDTDTITNALCLTNKITKRLHDKTFQDLELIRKRTSETLEKFNVTMDLVNYYTKFSTVATTSLETTKERFLEIYEEIVKPEDPVDTKTDSLEGLLIVVARRLTQDFKLGLQMGKDTADGLPEKISTTIEQGRKYAEDMYGTFQKSENLQDFSKKILGDIQVGMQHLQTTVKTVTAEIVNRLKPNTSSSTENGSYDDSFKSVT